MKLMKRLTVCLLTLVMLVTLCACGGSSDNASLDDVKHALLGYTTADFQLLLKGNLDEVYLGKFDAKYMDLVDTTEEACQENYLAGMAYEAEYFCYYFNVEYPTDEYLAEVTELYKEIYSHSKYTIGDVTELDENTYVAKMTIAPINIMELAVEAANNGALDSFYGKYTEAEINAMTDAEYEAYDQEWAQEVLDLVKAQLPSLGYNEEQSLAVQIVLQDNIWQISSTDMQSIDTLIIAYP